MAYFQVKYSYSRAVTLNTYNQNLPDGLSAEEAVTLLKANHLTNHVTCALVKIEDAERLHVTCDEADLTHVATVLHERGRTLAVEAPKPSEAVEQQAAAPAPVLEATSAPAQPVPVETTTAQPAPVVAEQAAQAAPVVTPVEQPQAAAPVVESNASTTPTPTPVVPTVEQPAPIVQQPAAPAPAPKPAPVLSQPTRPKLQ